MRSGTKRLLMVLFLVGCASEEPAPTAQEKTEVVGSNSGLTLEAITDNGIPSTGITANGIGSSALAGNAAFGTWFNADVALHDNLMQYVIACALPAGQSSVYVDAGSAQHTWPGLLGLAPEWQTGAIDPANESWVSSCILAGGSSNGTPVQLSYKGSNAALSSTFTENVTLSVFVGTFFGDLLTSTTAYACSTSAMRGTQSFVDLMVDQGRECPLDGCGGVYTVVDCNAACTPADPPFTACVVGTSTYSSPVNVYAPNYRAARTWTRSGVPLNTTRQNSLYGEALDFRSTTGYATAVLGYVAGDFLLDIRYSNGRTSDTFLKIQVNGVTFKNGTSDWWNFTPTGSFDTWATKTIAIPLTGTSAIRLVGGGHAKPGPMVDLGYLRIP